MSTCVQEPVNTTNAQIRELVTRAREAQAAFESFSQEQVDAIVKGIGKHGAHYSVPVGATSTVQPRAPKRMRQASEISFSIEAPPSRAVRRSGHSVVRTRPPPSGPLLAV